jgi:hypothetical protein
MRIIDSKYMFQSNIMSRVSWVTCLLLVLFFISEQTCAKRIVGADTIPGVRKMEDVVIYEDVKFHSAFPSVIRKNNGELLLAFRRAPNRKEFQENGTNHVDPNSYLVSVKSKDGKKWTSEPDLIYAHAFGGSQDPCLLQLKDGTILCASYGWAFVRPDGMSKLKTPYFQAGLATFLGGYWCGHQMALKAGKVPYFHRISNLKSTSRPWEVRFLHTIEGRCMKEKMAVFFGWLQQQIVRSRVKRLIIY